jgi:hypothetical protein
MRVEYALGHRDGTVHGPYPTEEGMWFNIMKFPGTPLGRIITDKRIGFYKHLDSVNGLCYAPPIYKNLPEYA